MLIKDNDLYYVGGVVRDEILGYESLDVDYCYEGNAIEFSKNLNVIKTNPDFGTVRILTEYGEIDIASTRMEEYPKKGHLPVVKVVGCSLKEDLKRRDFTINALAKNTVTKEIVDYFNGLEDIKLKKLRVLHKNSFIDDPSRIIRGLKFSTRFGFELDNDTLKLQEEYLNNVNYDMSYHRLKKELKETFNLNSYKAYSRFIEQKIYRLLGPNQPNISLDNKIENLVNKFLPKNIWLIYLGLYNLSNFELTKEEAEILDSYIKIKDKKANTRREIYNLFNKIPTESIILYALTKDYNTAITYLEELSKIKINLTGEDLVKLGIKQGKIYQEIFHFLIEQKLQNPELTKKEELNLVMCNYKYY